MRCKSTRIAQRRIAGLFLAIGALFFLLACPLVSGFAGGTQEALVNQQFADYNPRDQFDIPGAYDADGNTLKSPDGAATGDFYDAENHLVSRGADIQIRYDHAGNRVSKTVNGVTTRYVLDERNPTGYVQVLAEYTDLTGEPERAYAYGLDLISSRVNGFGTRYYGYDGQGSVRMLFDTSGSVTDSYDYDAYGVLLRQEVRDAQGQLVPINTAGAEVPTPNQYRYTGEQWDSDLGMYYLRARYYKPEIGRFWTMDSYQGNQTDPLSLHKYLYCHANPVNGIDPSGHDLVSTMSTMTIGTAIGMWSTIAANHALGRAQTYSSIVMGGAFGAAMGPLAVAIPEVGVGLGIYGMVGSGGIVYQTFSNPNATPSQKAAAVGLVVASIWGTKVAIKYSNATRVAPPAENVPAPGIPTFPLPLRSPPGVIIKSMAQNGLDGQKVGQLPSLISSMIEGKPIPYIAGMRNGNTYWINEGHTRMTAALELFNKTGNSSHVMKLLNEGNWKTGTPSTDIQMTSD